MYIMGDETEYHIVVSNVYSRGNIFSRQASLARQALLITALHDSRSKTVKKRGCTKQRAIWSGT